MEPLVKIIGIKPYHIALPYEHGAPKPVMGTGAIRTTMDAVYVRVDTDAGLSGWGECFGFAACPVTVAAMEKVVARLAIGRDVADISGLMSELRKRTQSMGLNGPVGFALSGFDIALWDIAGKVAGKPIYQLLGGDRVSEVPVYASLLRLAEREHVMRVASEAIARG